MGVTLAVLVSTGAMYVGMTSASLPVSGSTIVIGSRSPGSIVSAGPIPGLTAEVADASGQATRVVYRSTDARTGMLTEVLGSVFVPRSAAPPGGWLVVAVDHEGAGVGGGCVSSAPLIASLLRKGYAVAATDYQDRQSRGPSQFLDATTAGRNLIDAVRALRGTFPGVSSRWAVFGTGEGGDAAWAADREAAGYAGELALVGAVALSPVSDAGVLVDKAQNGTLTPAQRRTLSWLLASYSRTHPEVDLDDYRHGVVAQRWDELTACSGALVKEGTQQGTPAADDLDAFDLAPSSPEAAAALRAFISSYATTDGPMMAPLSVVYGEDGAASDQVQTTAAIGRGCVAGDTITWRLDRRASQLGNRWNGQLDWLGDRFSGAPVDNQCRLSSVSSPGAGSVLSTEAIPAVEAELPAGSSAARVLYESTDAETGTSTVVAGTVFTPPGAPPPGGWPVLGFGHGTTGIDVGCGPSLSPDLQSQTALVARFLQLNYAVAFTDYQGLGAPGVHRYLDSRTAGLNVIDSVRALRATFPGVSSRWVAFGHSQGGGAAWAADEQASTYAPELQLVAAVALSPPADVTGIVDKAIQGTLTQDQLPTFAAIVRSLSRSDPALDVDQFRRGSAVANWTYLSTCDRTFIEQRALAMTQVTAAELAPATPQAADELRRSLAGSALPQRTLSAPLSVVYGSDDTFIDARWTTDAVAKACALGDVMNVEIQPGRGHGDIDWTRQFAWMSDRFAGLPVTTTCPTE